MQYRRPCAVAMFLFALPSFAQSECGICHTKQAAQYRSTAMARALMKPAAKAELLGQDLSFQDGRWRYRIERKNGTATYSVTDGQTTLAAPILWSFGSGRAGQTYVFEHEGGFYESRVSYYTRIKGLDLTLGAHGSQPESIGMAAGRKMMDQDVSECFGCHSTGPSPQARFAMNAMHPSPRTPL